MTPIIIHKCDHKGRALWKYDGVVLEENDTTIKIEAFFKRDDYPTDYHVFRRGDRMVEWFYTDRWYNVFEMYDVDSQALKGWYCNITRPAYWNDDGIFADDLALDLMVYPNGDMRILDEDEFEALDLDQDTRELAQAGLRILIAHIEARADMFSKISVS